MFYGVVASPRLVQAIQQGLRPNHLIDQSPQCIFQIVPLLCEEWIDAWLPPALACACSANQQQMLEKLVSYLKITQQQLFAELCSMVKPPHRRAFKFLSGLLKKQAEPSYRVCLQLEPALHTNLQHYWHALAAKQRVDRYALAEIYKQLSEYFIRHLLYDFFLTLELTMTQRKVADQYLAQITQALHVSIDRFITQATQPELISLSRLHRALNH